MRPRTESERGVSGGVKGSEMVHVEFRGFQTAEIRDSEISRGQDSISGVQAGSLLFSQGFGKLQKRWTTPGH